jgi:hypothetical protein
MESNPALQSPPEHLVSADYLRLRTQVMAHGADADFNLDAPHQDSPESPRSYRTLREQLLSPTPQENARSGDSGV